MARAARNHRPALAFAVILALVLAFGAAFGGGGSDDGSDDGSSGSGGTDTGDSTATPSDAEYRSSLEDNSYADTFYEVWRCASTSPGTYTTAFGKASTSTTIKSRYLAHNVRLYMDGSLLERSDDVVSSVSNSSESNYVTSIPTATVSRELSCPKAFVATFRANSWHKGISIYDNRHSFYDEDLFDG